MSDVTRQKILDAALNAFSERSYDAVSLRSLVGAAGVNQAAINYHFRSKLGVYDILLNDISKILTEKQQQALKSCGSSPTLEEVLAGYSEPFLTHLQQDPKQIKFIARFFQEPSTFVEPRIEHTFGDTGRKFSKAIQKSVRGLSLREAIYALSQLNSSLVSAVANPLGDTLFEKPINEKNPIANLNRLITYHVAAIHNHAAPQDTSQGDLFG